MTIWLIAAAVLLLAIVAWSQRERVRARPVPDILKPGQPLPEFAALNEAGETVHSASLRGAPTIILLVRGTWCPFCSKQVANLTGHYKEITDSGARLILLTPRPLETTRRVADLFKVQFEFWLDESLTVAKQLGLVHAGGVPGGHRSDYGDDTLWPTTLVIDAAGIIRHSELSRFIADRPDPKKLLELVRKLPQ